MPILVKVRRETSGNSVRRFGPRDRKKITNWTELDRLGPDRWLRLHTLRKEKQLDTGVRYTGSPCKYLQNAPKNVKNNQDLTELLNFY
jgi:hypothetical protein